MPSYGHSYYILKQIYYSYKNSILSYNSFQFAGNTFILYISIFVSSQLPHTKIATQIYNEVASLSELKHQITVKNEAE